MKTTEIQSLTETKLARIIWLSEQDHGKTFDVLMHHMNEASLTECYAMIDGNKAKGIDNISKETYGQQLKDNIADLLQRMKRMAYRPQHIRRVDIPKENGKTRPLGISTFEDKIVQKMMQRILEAIYEPIFKSCSYGFRPGKGCHDALKDLHRHLYIDKIETVIDVDLADFFNTIDHKLLVEMLQIKIKDERLMHYIIRMMKAGVLAKGELVISEEGVAQGSICSPILANIFAHYVIDVWFEETVVSHCRGKIRMFRYADDIVITCTEHTDALRIKAALAKRLAKYQLRMNEEKTKLISFSKKHYDRGIRQECFDFLGFTFFLGKSRKGGIIPRLKTKKSAFRSKLKRVKAWIKEVKDKHPLPTLWKTYCTKLKGHIQYYGVSLNKEVSNFIDKATRIVFKGLNKRSQKKSFNWTQFGQFLKKYPLPPARVTVKLF